MRRTNTFIVRPSKAEEPVLYALLDNSARLYNELNYQRRQSYFAGSISWDYDELYHYYKKLIGSTTAQQIVRKNTESWKSYFALLNRWYAGELKANKPRPPGYWKDRGTGKRVLRTIIRNDSYSFTEEGECLKLPFKLKLTWRGNNKWHGKQGRLEIAYDALKKVYRCYQPVEVKPLHEPKGNKVAYIDLGVKCPIVVNIEGNVWGYKANRMLSDWWYWTHRISETQAELATIDRKSSKKLRILYRKRQVRFRDSVNKIIADCVKRCWEEGVAEIVCGDLKDIRASAKFSKKSNAMIHNFWSSGYQVRRLEEKSEEYGIVLSKKDERGTSSECPRCGSHRIVKRGRLFKCLDCRLEAHRDAAGSVNIGLAQGEVLAAGVINRAVARPTLICIEA